MNRPFDLQLFADGDVNSLDALDQLLSGNTPPATDPAVPPTTDPGTTTDPATTTTTDPAGGDPNLDDPNKAKDTNTNPEPKPDPVQDPKLNAAMAKLRMEAAQSSKVINELAKALGITETDPTKRTEVLLDLAYKKIAQANNAPVELYKELDQTKERMAQLQMQQNVTIAREKFFDLQTQYSLTQEELVDFANKLDEQGIILQNDPSIDLNSLFIQMNFNTLLEKRTKAAVEAALKTSNKADTNGSTPPANTSKGGDPEPPKVNSVSALDAILAGK